MNLDHTNKISGFPKRDKPIRLRKKKIGVLEYGGNVLAKFVGNYLY